MRIVSICPSNTELLAYLGKISDVVGVDDYSDWPESVNDLPRLGPDLSIDIDKVAALKPDLVVASLSVPGMEKNIEGLRQRGLPYVILNPNSLDDIAKDLLTLGELIGVKDHAKEIVSDYNAIIESYKLLASKVEDQPTLYWEWWPKPVFTPGQENWLTEISELAGAKNAFSDQEKASVKTDWQDILGRNPDHICLIWVGVSPDKVKATYILKRDHAEQLQAVKNGNIHELEEPFFCRPSPRLLVGLKRIAALIHPEIFPPFDPQDPLLKTHI